jgi:hypothetical protein
MVRWIDFGRLPIFPILTSVDVLTLGSYTKLPSCIKVTLIIFHSFKAISLIELYLKLGKNIASWKNKRWRKRVDLAELEPNHSMQISSLRAARTNEKFQDRFRLFLFELINQLLLNFLKWQTENGHVKFTVKNEFEIRLTLMSDNFKMPWRLLGLKILVKDSQDPSKLIYFY